MWCGCERVPLGMGPPLFVAVTGRSGGTSPVRCVQDRAGMRNKANNFDHPSFCPEVRATAGCAAGCLVRTSCEAAGRAKAVRLLEQRDGCPIVDAGVWLVARKALTAPRMQSCGRRDRPRRIGQSQCLELGSVDHLHSRSLDAVHADTDHFRRATASRCSIPHVGGRLRRCRAWGRSRLSSPITIA